MKVSECGLLNHRHMLLYALHILLKPILRLFVVHLPPQIDRHQN